MTQKHLFFNLCLGLLCCIALPTLGNIPATPPTLPGAGIDDESMSNTYAAVSPRSSSIEFIFLKNADNAQIEIYDAEDICVYESQGSAETYDRLKIEAGSWRGKHTLYLTVEGKTETFALSF